MWGPEFVLVYNEAYVPMIGDKHPAALGSPARVVFAEIWDTIGPMLEAARDGTATWVEDLPLLMDRHGYLEETYFTFSYSAVRGPQGETEGVIDIAAETTRQVLGYRRLALLSRLNDALADLESPEEVLTRALPVLREDPLDLPDLSAAPGEDGTWGRLAEGLAVRLSPHLEADETYLGFLRLIATALAQGLHRARAREAERRTTAVEREMSEALQRSLLTAPVQPDGLQVAVRYRPAAEGARLGGDWHDSFRLPDGRLTVVIGDVTGHDRHAAAAMTEVRNLLRGISYTLRATPAAVLTALDDALVGLGTAVLATVVVVQLEPAGPGRWLVRWSNAGHPPPLLLHPDGGAELLVTEPEALLGTRLAIRRGDHTVVLEPGAGLALYTDGLIERRHGSIDDGLAELIGSLAGRRQLTAEQVCNHLLAHFGHATDDDVALAVIRADPAGR
jgi:serine phosphatase RsbU (regulator of sigma subunit)